MEIFSSLSHAVVALTKDVLSNGVIDMYGNCTQSKIPYYQIQNSFDIFNYAWETVNLNAIGIL